MEMRPWVDLNHQPFGEQPNALTDCATETAFERIKNFKSFVSTQKTMFKIFCHFLLLFSPLSNEKFQYESNYLKINLLIY